MAKAAGRLAVLSKAATPIAGVKVTKISWAGESIDVTDRDADGVLTVLATVKRQQITLEVSGIYTSPTLRDIAFTIATAKLLTDLTFKFSDALTAADTITGNFFLNSYDEDNPEDDATQFSASFTSSGAWTLG